MKILKYLLITGLFFFLAWPASAVEEDNLQNQFGQQVQQAQQQMSGLNQENPGQNQFQNQEQIQNQGEESQLQIANLNLERVMNMTGLSEEVVGQLSAIAQEQVQVQAQMQEQYQKLASKSKLARFFTGADYGAIKNLKQLKEQNQSRIRELQQLEDKLANQGSATMIQEIIQALEQENTALQERIQAEEKIGGLFGWLLRLFRR